MVQKQTYLTVADNSGAKSVQVIHVVGSTNKKYATVGDLVVVAVKSAISNAVAKKSEVFKAVLVRTRKETRRTDGSYIRFDDNAAVLLNKEGKPVGTRLFGPIARELRKLGFPEIISMAQEVL